jgi:hypothetical protein
MQFGSLEYFSVEPEHYLFDGTEFGHPNNCVFGIFSHLGEDLNDRYILGAAFL